MSIVNDNMSDTPETDAQGYGDGRHPWVATDFARKLERERDDLQKAVNGLCEHFKVSPANTTLLAVEVLKIERERDEAREALREIWQSGDAFLPYIDNETTNRWRKAAGL
jgi:hypothetical protein